VRAKEIEIRSADAGWDAELGAAGEPPPDEFAGWQLVGGAEDIGTRQTIPIDTRGRSYRYYLIWITKLTEVSDGYRVEISDARLFG
jgi:eukaryotic-like serine/threonine-protein kinase